MKLTVRQENLLESLQDVVSVVPSKSTLPILSTVLMEVKDGKLTLTATDLDISIRAALVEGLQVETEGRICVPARKFTELVKELGPSDVTLMLAKNVLKITSGGTYKIVTADPTDFPEIPKLEDATTLEIESGKLEKLIRRTSYAVASDETRPELTGVYTQIFPEEIRMVATNGHRLAQASIKGDFKEKLSYLLPTKALQQLLRIMNDSSKAVRITGSKSYAAFEINGKTLITRLLEGPFPRYEQVIPKDNSYVVSAPLHAFRAALRRALVLADPVTRPVKLQVEKGRLKIIVETQNVGESDEEIDVNYDGVDLKIGFNGVYLLDLLKTVESERVNIALESSTTAGVFTPDEESPEEPILCLVMPLRLTDE
ncbi:MAG: DNA polymerase III subunit beta [Candidatus Eisenbacteria bacterium]|uniref:Beta sliding clamp n=1 Tax=Eiseniibacteriota bacterium TaxID=2212470 RepID=A0A948RZM1_UNCEI|nr:DNA polymerase III subunit beta [Candidatus Eisenbacteria bacterium]MBU1947443.1 DNA polymerase III subunit beta [Candidatus Eisenbacteria bacterium]MBU2693321.1 DNA polymerase III subunit beta [Candidatus Eisenbacteria bacterium]